ncbi:MAG: hypothetical protein ACXVBZ_06375 [Flavisolibacter sp.]
MPKRPPCPGDPEDYVWVESGETPHWRRKRGSLKKASLNSAFKNANDSTKIVAPAAKRVRNALAPYMRGLRPGRLQNRISSAFRKSLKEKGQLGLGCLKDVEIQRDYPLDSLVVCQYEVSVGEEDLKIKIPIDWSSVKQFNNLVTNYYFEAIVLWGDVNSGERFKTDSVESALYSIRTEKESVCVLELEKPADDWCLLLKVTSHEGDQMAAHTKHYRMKVVEVCESKK